ncbi:helicase [Reyranella soli]|uniref:Helicase n=2 Tax=Reyranella soli TaxID=1230389 RepID=A0A512NEF3_9HYPH|nr:helicase [Reyranella soli]
MRDLLSDLDPAPPVKELVLYDYQSAAIDAARENIRRGHRRQILCSPTGSGKTIMGLGLMQGAMRAGSRSAFVTDRTALVDQTSTALDLYGLDHGVMQATHWRQRPGALVQLVSAQTLGRRLGRGGYVDSHLRDLRFVLIDEVHTLYDSTLEWLAMLPEHVAVIGLTATPFTKGLGRHYGAIVNVASTDALIERGMLARPLVYVATTEMDTSGVAVRSTGEWDDGGLERAGVQIVGDVVSEYVKRSGEHFGGSVKTIVFSSSVRHGEEICRAFAQVGLNFANISYHDSEDDRRAKIAEFRKPDSAITGLVSCDALAKGFDVPDVLVGILCRPLRKSFTTHIQQLGRVMRSHPGKDKALVIDHTGNCLRFLNDTVEFWRDGVDKLDEGAERDRTARPSATEKERKELVCLGCQAILPPGVSACLACGRERPRRPSNVTTIRGTTHCLHMGATSGRKFDFDNHAILRNREVAYRTFLAYAVRGKKGDGEAARRWAAAMFKGVYGAFPPWSYNDHIDHDPAYLTLDAERFCRNEMARYSKKRPTNAAAA